MASKDCPAAGKVADAEVVDPATVATWAAALEERHPVYSTLLPAATQLGVRALAIDRKAVAAHDHMFSHGVATEAKATSQKSSGRCWLFAGLNTLRTALIDKLSIPSDFELSQGYLAYWDKVEKVNYVLETLLGTIEEETAANGGAPESGRLWSYILKSPLIDGGQYAMFAALVSKYGIVPKSVYPDSHDAGNTRALNTLLCNKLRETAAAFAAMHKAATASGPLTDASRAALFAAMRARKHRVLQQLHATISLHLGGAPPARFRWRHMSKKTFACTEEMTPLQFYNTIVRPAIGECVTTRVALVNDPRNAYEQPYTVAHLGNVWRAPRVRYINAPSQTLLDVVAYAIVVRQVPVWFGADAGKGGLREQGIWDHTALQYGKVLGTNVGVVGSTGSTAISGVTTDAGADSDVPDDFVFDKGARLHFGDSLMTHAMVFTKVDICPQSKRVLRLRVENSWGEKEGDKGFYSVTAQWFHEYCYQIQVAREDLPPAAAAHKPEDCALDYPHNVTLGFSVDDVLAKEDTVLPLWDPMGALALQGEKEKSC